MSAPCWINNDASLPPGSSEGVLYLSTKPASCSLRVLRVSLQNTICPPNIHTSHTTLQHFFLKGNCFSAPLLPLLGHVELVKILYWYTIANHNVCSGKHIYKYSFKNAMSIFSTYFRGFIGKKVYRPGLKKIYFSNIKNKLKESC